MAEPTPTNHERATEVAELKRRHAVLEERMKTLQSDLQGTLERFRADMADWKTDMAQRENRQLLATIVIVGVAAALLGLLITAQ